MMQKINLIDPKVKNLDEICQHIRDVLKPYLQRLYDEYSHKQTLHMITDISPREGMEFVIYLNFQPTETTSGVQIHINPNKHRDNFTIYYGSRSHDWDETYHPHDYEKFDRDLIDALGSYLHFHGFWPGNKDFRIKTNI